MAIPKTLEIFGLSRVGSLVARAGSELGINVLVWGREQLVLRSHDAGYEVAANQAELFERADVLSVHLPVNAETRGVVVAAELARLKRSALLVNTSGAQLISPRTLLNALHNGHPGFTALGVDHDYLLGGDDPALLQLPNVLCLPDIGWREADRVEMLMRVSFASILADINGGVGVVEQPKQALARPA